MGDKTEWGPGPWQTEPDRVEWRHAGLPCLARRGPLGNWCGYVAVPPSHPDHDADYSDVPVDVHGGLTYGARCDGDEEDGICHVPHGGEPADVFWLGFDCAHYSDLVPEVEAYGVKDPTATYRDLDYVRAETNGLAEQLAVPA